ncbi:MAG: thiolase domain-containing protein [Coriobacteriia bacterium]
MRAFIIGAGKTKFGPTTYTLTQLLHQAITRALDDAGLRVTELGAFVVANFLGGPNNSQLHLNAVVAGLFPGVRMPGWRVEAACASGGVALHQAILSLSAYDPVLVVGVEKLSGLGGSELTHNIGMAGDAEIDQSQGLTFPGNYALIAQEHMRLHGTRLTDLEAVALKNHANARFNPNAHFQHKTVTQADIDAGATVAAPLRLFDCCPISDGAAALVISREPADARSLRVLGSAVRADVISLAQREEWTTFPAAREAAVDAYSQADIVASDVDLAEVHDCFTIAEIVAMEDLGLARPGEAVERLRAGDTQIGGPVPVNASGGLKAGGHAIGATGISQVYELVKQIRGEAGEAQVARASVGVAHNIGGIGGTAAVHVIGRS